MTTRRGALLLLAGATAMRAQERCGVGQDFVVRALERLGADAAQSDLEDALQLLKHATETCPDLGDAWHYRAIVEQRLGRPKLAEYAAGKAKLLGSEAAAEERSPFRLAAPPTAPPPPQQIQSKHALVVGIGQYQASGINPLRFATKDAKDFAGALVDGECGRFPRANVRLLLNEEATTARVKMELNRIARAAAPDDLVVIFLAAHGSPRERDTAGVNYVITYDTSIADEDQLFATALPMVDISDIVRTRISARRAAIFLDTCHSGGAVPTSAPSSSMLARMREGQGRTIIASSQVSEVSWESVPLQNGFFTHYLIQGLRQQRGLAPLSEVYRYVREQVSTAVLSSMRAKQTPVMSRSDQGVEIVLGAPPAVAQAAKVAACDAPSPDRQGSWHS